MVRIKTLIKFTAIICSAFYIAIENTDDRYWLMWLLPVTYAFILMLIDITTGKRSREVGYRALKIVMLFRYVLTPISVVASQYYVGAGPEPSQSSITFAIVLMVYELICVGIAITIYNIKNKVGSNQDKVKELISENSSILWAFIFISFVIISAINLRLIIPANMIFITSDIQRITLDMENSGGIIILRNVLRIILGIALLNLINKIKTTYKTKMILSILTIIFIISLYTSTARWDTLSIAFVGIILLSNLYSKYSKTIIISIGSIMVIALTSITLYKFLGYTSSNITSFINAFTEMVEVTSKQFQVYFSGPRNIALAVDMSKSINANWTWLINDLLGSFPGLSQYFDQTIRFNYVFNRYIYSGSIITQIIPLVGIGYIVLGFIFSPLITVGFILLVLKLNDLYRINIFISTNYLLLYMIIYTSMCMGMNLQILTNKYFAVFIPAFLVLMANRLRLRFSSEKRKTERLSLTNQPNYKSYLPKG